MKLHWTRTLFASLAVAVGTATAVADEGMWLFNNPPKDGTQRNRWRWLHGPDWEKYLLFLQMLLYGLSAFILFMRRARRYYHPPLYVDE